MPRARTILRGPDTRLRHCIRLGRVKEVAAHLCVRPFPDFFGDDLRAAVEAHPRVLPVVLQAVVDQAKRGWIHSPHLDKSMVQGIAHAAESGRGAAMRQVLATASELWMLLDLTNWKYVATVVGLTNNKDVVAALLDQLAAPDSTLATADQIAPILMCLLETACPVGHLRTVRQVLAFGVAHRVQLHAWRPLCAAIHRGQVSAVRALSEYKYADKYALMRMALMPTHQFKVNWWWGVGKAWSEIALYHNPMENALRATPATLNAVLNTEWGREWVTRRPKWCLKFAVGCCWHTAKTLRALLRHNAAPDWAPYMVSALRFAEHLDRYHALLELVTTCDLEAVRRSNPRVLTAIQDNARMLLVDTESNPAKWEDKRALCAAIKNALEP
jgi:hypothetical protein